MRFPILLTPAKEGGFIVTVPDLPGCFSEGDTYEEACSQAREAVQLHLRGLFEDGMPVPLASPVERILKRTEAKDQVAIVEVDERAIARSTRRRAARVSVTLPQDLLSRIDRECKRRREPRSLFLQRAAETLLAKKAS